MKRIAIAAGGYSGEHEVSLRSQAGIISFLEGYPYELFKLFVSRERWWVEDHDGHLYDINRNNFTFTRTNGEEVHFHYLYNNIHGTPGEDGLFTGYLDMMGIPYSSCPTPVASLTFDKFFCNRYLSTFGIRIANSVCLRSSEAWSESSILQALRLPLFVKPNTGGSSIATTRVERAEELAPAVRAAFAEAPQVMVEELIVGTEVTCGAYQCAEGLRVLPVTEVVPKNKFFDYDAKYNGAVEEITPARISQPLTLQIQELTRNIYHHLGARGIIRVDFIITPQNGPLLLEVNTTPGMTHTSFIPQQVAAAGLKMGDVLASIIDYHIK